MKPNVEAANRAGKADPVGLAVASGNARFAVDDVIEY
jgi:hypothetical protein